MSPRLSSSPDAATSIGILLLAAATVAMVSHLFGVTDGLVSMNCGAAPTLSYVEIDAYIAFLDCKRTIEQHYWTVVALLGGLAVGYGSRAWLRREAKQGAETDQQLDDEMARIRADKENRPSA